MLSAKTITSNFFWRFFERCGAQVVAFFVAIILARLLDPAAYGLIALITIFTTILQVFVDSGLGNALIQKKNADDLDFSSVFYFNIITCLILYGLMFLTAPFIAIFYSQPQLTPIIRILSLTIVISGVRNVQQAFVSKKLIFKKFFWATLTGTIVSAIVGFGMAYKGYGVWSLVGQQLSNTTINTLVLWLIVKWRPKLIFSISRLKSLFNYGWKLLASALLDTSYNQLRQLIIGKMYTPQELAFYNQGYRFPNVITTNINISINSVLFPCMSAEQDDITRVQHITRNAIEISTYILAPLMMGLAVCAEPLTRIILTEKWIPCVSFMRIFCIVAILWPINAANTNAIQALGESGAILKLEIIKKIIGTLTILLTMNFGPLAIAYGVLASSILNQVINSLPNKRFLNYGYFSQMKDITPQIILTCFMGILTYSVTLFHLNDYVTIIVQFIIGISSYILMSIIFQIRSYTYIRNLLRQQLKKFNITSP